MAMVVVGGQTKGVGKTSVAAGLIAALAERRWTAFKISLARSGEEYAGVEVSEEKDAGQTTDTARFLTAGAARAFWVRARREDLAEAMARIRPQIEAAENVLIESNSVVGLLRPDVYLSVIDPAVEDFKLSARELLERADAVLVQEGSLRNIVVEGTTVLAMRPPVYVTAEVAEFVRERLREV
ncbi:hypothetical protein [Edaphobacter sp.]|uniref:hypothetical protein n=1 Tax=Edaphobacter sp. TaxID=1934404 RepID=UPI002DBA355F|nr:hypothetical protein [Edaphobacter sp.]HEU5341441.1 hypothetical protein [Edaphobacter sp.]